MSKKTYKQVLELTKNPHYTLSDEDIEVLSSDFDDDYYPEKKKSKREKNQFKKIVGEFNKTFEIEE